MNYSLEFDENLSEELLSENASASAVKMSPNVEKNMSGSMFHFKFGINKESKFKPCLATKNARNTVCAIGLPTNIKNEMPIIRQRTFNASSKTNIQRDIKILLNQAIKIRNSSNCDSKEMTSKKFSRKAPLLKRLERGITMGDIDAPLPPNPYS